jgi:hypothetical protein
MPQVEHLRLDLAAVQVVQRDLLRNAPDEAGIGKGRANAPRADDGDLDRTSSSFPHPRPPRIIAALAATTDPQPAEPPMA